MKNFQKLIFSVCLILVSSAITAQTIIKLEPPNWWAGMQSDTLELMVYGIDIQDIKVSCNNENIKIIEVFAQNIDYAFVKLLISKNTKAQKIRLNFSKANFNKSIEYELLPNDNFAPGGFDNKDLVYLIMPDRFSNGSVANDNVSDMEQQNRKHPGGRHGGDLAGISKNLDYLTALGVTTVWLTPFQEMNDKQYSYHGYGASNYYEADARYTSGQQYSTENNAQYKKFVEDCHSKKIKVIMDVVTNHIGGQHYWQLHQPRLLNWVHDSIINMFAMPSLTDPYASDADKKNMERGWFVPSMPDLNQDNPHLSTYLIQKDIWWIKFAHIDGIRLDTEPFSEKHFLTKWATELQNEFPTLGLVGEVWSSHNQPTIGKYWQKSITNKDGYSSNIPNVMDMPLWEYATQALKKNDAQKLYYMLSQDFVYDEPSKNFGILGNHDMERFFTTIDSSIEKYKLGIVFLATINRIPQLYYGDEIGMTGKKNIDDGYVRADMPGGWLGDTKNIFTGKGYESNDKEMQLLKFNQQIWNWRKNQEAIHFGHLKHYYPKQGVYIYSNSYDHETVVVLLNFKNEKVICNKSDYKEVLGTANEVQFASKGIVVNKETIEMPALGYLVLKGKTILIPTELQDKK